jgi:DNA-binding HxlR family transcriptional regulator
MFDNLDMFDNLPDIDNEKVSIINGKIKKKIIYILYKEAKVDRKTIKSILNNVTDSELLKALKELEVNGLLKKDKIKEEYTLSLTGKSMVNMIIGLHQF